MSIARQRREASKRLGLELRKRYEALVLANGEQEIMRASVPLGALFNENIEQIIWFLLEYGGVEQMPLAPRAAVNRPLAEKLPETPALLLAK